MRIITHVARFLVGALFIFSGLIKANDTLGFSYKLDEYFEVFGMEFMIPASLILSMFICVFEIVLGVALLIGARRNLTLWLLLLMIVFFSFLTFYSAYFNKVTSCGCFGDAIPLTPWQSFTKDIILLVLIILLFIGRSNIEPLAGNRFENVLMVLSLLGSVMFTYRTYSNLPVWDFRPYAVGKNIPEQTLGTPDKLKYYYTFKNLTSGEEKEFDVWQSDTLQWKYISNRYEIVEKGIEPKIKDFSISDAEGQDLTEVILNNPNFNFLLIAYDLDKTNKKVQNKINDFVALCQQDGYEFIGLTASPPEKINEFRHDVQAMYDYYNTDGTVLKTMIRSNPGLMLLKNGSVVAMWHFNSFPSYNEVKNTILDKK